MSKESMEWAMERLAEAAERCAASHHSLTDRVSDLLAVVEDIEQKAWRAGLDEGRRQKELELAEAEDGRLQALEALVRGVGHDEAGVVDSMARSDVAAAMAELADAGRMQIQSSFGRRVFATWVTP